MVRDYSAFLPTNNSPQYRARSAEQSLSPLPKLGWRPFFAQQISVDELVETPPARVFEVHRNALQVMGDDVDQLIPPRTDATVGDWILLDRKRPQASKVLRRKSVLKRRAPGTDRRVQLIAANIDTAFIVSSCNQDFNIARLERYIALAFEAEITPVVVLTKADLSATPQDYAAEARAISDLVPIVALDARGDEPREKLASWRKPGETIVFLGSSGVGKSTLANALTGEDAIETQAIREDDAKGRHTTTRRQLHVTPDGGLILDTPGMRELQLADAAAGVDEVFADLFELSQRCRFSDCQHVTEPGCAVLDALERGAIDAARLGRWRKLMAEDAFNSASLAERRTKDRAFGKMVRQAMKAKGKRAP